MNAEGLATVKAACKAKFPQVFDFGAIARQAEVASWEVVAKKSDFLSLEPEAKLQARREYFESVVRPRVPPDNIEDADAQFEAFARKVERASTTQAVAASAPASASSITK